MDLFALLSISKVVLPDIFFCQAVPVFLLKIINDEISIDANKITLYFIGVIKQVLKIVCDNETINILLYL